MVQVVRWYLSAFHAGRRSEVAKKPYNPILGEVFRYFFAMFFIYQCGFIYHECSAKALYTTQNSIDSTSICGNDKVSFVSATISFLI